MPRSRSAETGWRFRRNGIGVPARPGRPLAQRANSDGRQKATLTLRLTASHAPPESLRANANIIFPLQGFCSLRLYVPPRLFSAAFSARFSPPKSPVFGPQNTPPSCGLRSAAANISPISPLLDEIVRIRSLIGSKWKAARKGIPHEAEKHAHVRGSHMRRVSAGCRARGSRDPNRDHSLFPTGPRPGWCPGLAPFPTPEHAAAQDINRVASSKTTV